MKERGSNGLAYGLYASDNTANPPAGYIHTNGSDRGAVGTSALTVNSWNHLATTYDGQSLRLYVNGALVTSHEVSGNISTSGQPLRLGGNTVFADEYFSGLIDDVRIYNRPLTHGEVLYNMSTPVGGTPDSTAPTASISSPANGATVSGQVMVNVTATDNVAVGAVRLRINGAPWATDTQAPYQILLDTRQLPNGSYTLSGEVQDVIGNVTSLASRTIHVANATDTTPPTLTLLNPDAGQQVAGEVVLSAFSADDVAVAGVQFRVDGNNLGGEDNAAPYQRVWNTATVADGPHQIEVISRDASGNTTSQSLSLIVDNTAPTLSSQTPNAGASSVSPSIQPSAVFSEDIRASVSQFELRDSGGGLVAASVQYDSNLRKLSLIPDQSLLLDEIYSVSLSGVQDLAGNAAAAISWSFSTGNTQGDTVPPTLASHQPASGAVDIAINTTVLATFSEPIQPATLSFVLRDASNNVVGASVSYNNVTREATLSPNLPLADYSTYTATVSGAMDIAGNKMQPVSWTFTTSSFAPVLVSSYPEPSSTNFPPSADLSVTFSEPIVFATLNFVLTGPGGQNIAGAVSYDNSIRTATFNPSQELAPQTVYSVSVSAQDAEGNSSNSQWSFTSGAALSGLTIWNTATTPAVASANDTSAVELGVKFRADLDGFVTGLRFYKGPFNTGTHSGHIWAADGTLLGSATFTNEASGGWQQVDFDSPIAIVANATYVASYYAPNGGYAYDSGYFSGGSVTNGHLTALGQGVQGGNGVYRYGVGGGFPSLSFNATNYWIDVVFATSLADSTAPTVTSQSPPPGATNIATNTSVAATFSEAVEATSIVFSLRDANGDVVPSVLSYDNNTQTASLTPNAVLQGGVTYTATLGGARDSAGNAMATVNWSFTTGGLVSNASLWNQNTIPAVSSSNDSAAVELGVKFRADRDGFLQGIRFYKGNANTGTHVGNLWSADGSLLASATFTNETALGWQTVNFALPVAITADTTYVASYFAPNGGYAYNHGYFATAFVNGALRALATGEDGGNGVYRYGSSSAFPSEFYNSSNYWVDVVFSQSLDDTQPPTLLNQSPAPASFGIATHADITAVFSEAVQPATISFQLHDQWNNLVPADVSY
ncbi:MAG: DUF4082 domain-containing protein, partial [Planctomycetales bacterium]|nr:DUF4082 domain-containing protein [Planctomycetales bacterium]